MLIVLAASVLFFHSVEAIAVGFVLSAWLDVWVTSLPLRKLLGYGFLDQLRDVWKSGLSALVMALCAVSALADVAADVEAGQALTHDELVEKALAETGDFVVYGNTSRIATALEGFAALYPTIPCPAANNLKDQEIYTKLRNENGNSAADMVMIQDGA